jgi:hypothetical protein
MSLYTPYRTLFCHRSPSRENTPSSVPHDLGDSALSARPRPTVGQQGGKSDVARDSGSFHCLVPYITMVSRDGRPFLGHVATATSTGINKTSPQDSPGAPASSYPIKGQARALQGDTKQDASQKPSANKQRHTTHRSTSQAISFVLSFFL